MPKNLGSDKKSRKNNTYNLYIAPEYIRVRTASLAAPRDISLECDRNKEIKYEIARSLRKHMEGTGYHHGKLFDANTIEDKFPMFKNDKEFVKNINCLVEEYNDNYAYKKRLVKVRRYKHPYVPVKKHVTSFFAQTRAELHTLVRSHHKKYKSIRRAYLFFEIIIKHYFIVRLPNKISFELYNECLTHDENFSKYYHVKEDCATIVRKYKGTVLHSLNNEDIIWCFIYVYLKKYKLIE